MKAIYFLMGTLVLMGITLGILIGETIDAGILKNECSTTGVSRIANTHIICAVTN